MKKKVGIIKRVLCIGLVFLLSINSFAAIVSDNDGSAFITKSEFDALKSSFQSQIDSYNNSIDSKIDGAIASYLAGIKLSNVVEQQTLFDSYINNKYFYGDDMSGYIQFLEKDDTVKNTRTWSPFSLKLMSLRHMVTNDAGTLGGYASAWIVETQPDLGGGHTCRYCLQDGRYLCYATSYESIFDYTVGGARNSNGTGVVFLPFFKWSTSIHIASEWTKFNVNQWGYTNEGNYNIYIIYGKIVQSIDRYDLTDTTKKFGKRNSIVTPWKTNSSLSAGNKEMIADLSAEDVYYYNGDGDAYTNFSHTLGCDRTNPPYIKTATFTSSYYTKDQSEMTFNYRTESGQKAVKNSLVNLSNTDITFYGVRYLCFDNIFKDTNLMDYPVSFAYDVDSANTKMSYGLKLFKSQNTGIAKLNVSTKNKGYVIVYESDTGDTNWAGLKTQYLNGTIASKFSFDTNETKDLMFNVSKNKTYWFVGVPTTEEIIGIKINGCTVEKEN